jgi:Lon protease-like protein
MSLEELPIFPLSNVVLFPRIQTPLHLFEPRYLALARDVLAGGRRIGMVTVPPAHVEEMQGDPPVFPIGCCGVVTESQQQPDGRYNVVLLGEHRFQIADEQPRPGDRLYRVARVRRLEDAYPPDERDRVARLRDRISLQVVALVRRIQPERADAFDPEIFAEVDDATFVNALSNAFAFPVEEKQNLLDADSIPERFGRLEAVLSFRRAEFEAGGGAGTGRIH